MHSYCMRGGSYCVCGWVGEVEGCLGFKSMQCRVGAIVPRVVYEWSQFQMY